MYENNLPNLSVVCGRENCEEPALYYSSARHGKDEFSCIKHLGECIDALHQHDPDVITVYHIIHKGHLF